MISRFTRKDFLEALFLEYYREHKGFILVKSLKRGDSKMGTRYFPNIDILAREHYSEERDVYFGICPRERMKAEKEHIHYLVALWADLDIGRDGHEDKKLYFEGPQQAARAIRSFPRAPSIIVESGRGAHLYWLMKHIHEVEGPERVESILHKLSDHLNCDTDVSVDTVLRLPETVNTKIPDQPVHCEVKFINTNFRYTLEDFENISRRIVAPTGTGATVSPIRSVAGKSPTSDRQVRQAVAAAVETRGEPVADSLIVDETIIDELIDDISMTAGSLPEVAASPEVIVSAEVETIAPAITDVFPEPARPPSKPVKPHPERPRPAVSHAKHPEPPPAYTSTVLEKLMESRAQVEIAVVGSDKMITGVLTWNQNGLIGVESGGDLYTIPLANISFIRTRAG